MTKIVRLVRILLILIAASLVGVLEVLWLSKVFLPIYAFAALLPLTALAAIFFDRHLMRWKE